MRCLLITDNTFAAYYLSIIRSSKDLANRVDTAVQIQKWFDECAISLEQQSTLKRATCAESEPLQEHC